MDASEQAAAREQLGVSRENWNTAARQDAVGSILTDRHYDLDAFFESGRTEIDRILGRADELGLRGKRRRALDFGCGLGRLAEALADEYLYVDAVDASNEMIDQVEARDGWRAPNVTYRVIEDRLPFRAGRFDLVVSLLCLQHFPADLQRTYVEEFVRVLAPGGIAIIQIPEGDINDSHPFPWLSMYGTDRVKVEGWVREAGGEVRDVDDSADYAGSPWHSWAYTFSSDGTVTEKPTQK